MRTLALTLCLSCAGRRAPIELCLSTPPPEAPAIAVYTTGRDEIEAMLRDRVHELEAWSENAWRECGR